MTTLGAPRDNPLMTPEQEAVLSIATRIQQRIAALQLSERDMCLRAGVGVDTVRDMRRRAQSPSAITLIKLAPVLRCRLEWLLTGDGPVTNEVAELSPAQRAALDQFDRLPPDEQARAIKIMRGLEPDDGKPSEAAS